MSKKKLINIYYRHRRINNDIYSDSYRGGMDYYLYVPYSFNDIKNKWSNYISNNNIGDIDFYIHIPFCFTLCKYCDYYKELVKKNSIDDYLDYIYWYLGEYKDIFKGKKFRSLYIGGGTPSILSDKQIDNLLNYIFSNFEFEKDGEITFEVNPVNITRKKAEVISKYHINRISMGIQSVDPKVLDASNRSYQKENSVKKAVDFLLEAGFKNISGDVIMGLKEDTIGSLDETIEKMISWGFSSIVLYWLLPTDEYLNEHFNGKLDLFYDEILPRISSYYNHINNNILKKYVFDEVNIKESNGYRWDLIIKKSNLIKYDDFSQASLFGVGSSARSHIYGELYYKTVDTIKFNKKNESVIYLGRNITVKDEKALFNIISFTNKEKIDIKKYNSLFNGNFTLEYKDFISLLNTKKIGELDGDFLNSKVPFIDKNYYALFFIDDFELKNRIYFLENDICVKIIFKNGLNIGIKFIFNESKFDYILYNYYTINNSNIEFYYKINKGLIVIFNKINKLYFSLYNQDNLKKIALKIIIDNYKDFILKIYNN